MPSQPRVLVRLLGIFCALAGGMSHSAKPPKKLPPGIRLGPYKTTAPAREAAAETPAKPPPVPPPASLKKSVERVFPAGVLQQLDAGVLAVSLDTGDVLYEHSPDKQLVPASVSKLFTAYAALKKMKPTSTFETTVWAQGPVMDGRLEGDLYIKGGGDPSLVSERLWMMVNELVRSGIQKISGDIIVDDSYFDRERTPDSRPSYLTDEAYNAPIGALSFNFNTTTIYVKPAETAGKPPVVYTDPENSYVDVVNQATTGKEGGRSTIQVKRTDFVKGDIGDTVLLRGSIPIGHRELRFYRNIVNPSLYAAHMFKAFWEQRGMRLTGTVKEGTVPGKARQVLHFESLPLWQVIWGMNKFSNNFVADQTLKKLGAEAFGVPGTREKGLKSLEAMLQDIGIEPNSYAIQDGSGLTRKTRVTPRQIVKVLTAAAGDLSISAEFIASLGVGGEDGTLRNRFPSTGGQTILRGKTGSLDGVAALAGYTATRDGEDIAFAILLNDPRMKYGRMSSWVDKIALEFAQFSRKP